jgi:hypothetical protein
MTPRDQSFKHYKSGVIVPAELQTQGEKMNKFHDSSKADEGIFAKKKSG